jgi:hypothetical protein
MVIIHERPSLNVPLRKSTRYFFWERTPKCLTSVLCRSRTAEVQIVWHGLLYVDVLHHLQSYGELASQQFFIIA